MFWNEGRVTCLPSNRQTLLKRSVSSPLRGIKTGGGGHQATVKDREDVIFGTEDPYLQIAPLL